MIILRIFLPTFMNYAFKILPNACSLLTEVVFLLYPIDVIHYTNNFPNIKSLFHSKDSLSNCGGQFF